MARRIQVAVVGGGSYGWMPTLMRDIILTPGLEEVSFRLLDVNRRAAEETAALGRRMSREWDLGATFLPTDDEGEALDGADFIIITISTGGFDAMQHDVHLPEKYGIYQTVGDTVGPGGWARALRNVPVFVHLAAQARKYAPRAAILNYTNPMAALTRTLSLCTGQPVVGLCHGLFEVYTVLQRIFGLASETDIKANVAGVNHFFWLLDLRVRGRDGYAMLRRRLRGRSFAELACDPRGAGSIFHSRMLVAQDLFERCGRIPYIGDRHTSEFLGGYLAPGRVNLAKYGIVRTPVAWRRKDARRKRKQVLAMASGRAPIERRRSRESAADIIRTVSLGGDFIDVVNTPNRGQVSNLPHGAVVETLGVVNALGFNPLAAGPLPGNILALVLPHALNQERVVRAAMEGDRAAALDALAAEPLCSHLTGRQVRKMGMELMDRTSRWLPQFYSR